MGLKKVENINVVDVHCKLDYLLVKQRSLYFQVNVAMYLLPFGKTKLCVLAECYVSP